MSLYFNKQILNFSFHLALCGTSICMCQYTRFWILAPSRVLFMTPLRKVVDCLFRLPLLVKWGCYSFLLSVKNVRIVLVYDWLLFTNWLWEHQSPFFRSWLLGSTFQNSIILLQAMGYFIVLFYPKRNCYFTKLYMWDIERPCKLFWLSHVITDPEKELHC